MSRGRSANPPSYSRPEKKRLSVRDGLQIIRFHVWQDLSASENEDVAPLHATVTVEMTNEWYLNLSKPGGVVRIDGLDGGGSIEAKLVIHQAHYGLGLGQPGSRQLQFVMSPTPMYVKLRSNELVRGIVRIKFHDRQVTMRLPETRVIFTR